MDCFTDFFATFLDLGTLCMEGQRALGFHQKYLNLCSEDERRSYGFGTTWGRVIKDRIFILGWTNPLINHNLTGSIFSWTVLLTVLMGGSKIWQGSTNLQNTGWEALISESRGFNAERLCAGLSAGRADGEGRVSEPE